MVAEADTTAVVEELVERVLKPTEFVQAKDMVEEDHPSFQDMPE